VKSSPWAWQRLFDQPASLSFANSLDNADLVGGRFCAWVRGGDLNAAVGGTQALQVQVAVVYPGAFGSLNDCRSVNVVNLDNTGDAYPGESLEEAGLRVAYSGTVVTPK
jgi:hypothetical protein